MYCPDRRSKCMFLKTHEFMKLMFVFLFGLLFTLNSCVSNHNDAWKNDGEIPPWGGSPAGGQIWAEGRLIQKDPRTSTMDEVFLDLGFYDSGRDSMENLIRSVSRKGLFIVDENYLFYSGSGSDPKLEIYRFIKGEAVVLKVYVANFQGFDDSIVWKYRIGYDAALGRWVFDEIEGVRGHQWK